MHCPQCGQEVSAGIVFCPNCGHKFDQNSNPQTSQPVYQEQQTFQPQQDQSQPLPQGRQQFSAPSPQKPKKPVNKAKVITISVIVAIVVIAAIAGGIVLTRLSDPKAVATQYLSALESGNYDKATSLSDIPTPSSSTPLLSSKFATQQDKRISGSEITSVNHNGNVYTINVSYNLNGSRANSSIEETASGGLVKKFTVTRGLTKTISMEIPDVLENLPLVVNGAKTPAPSSPTNKRSYLVYPGSYTFAVDSKYVETKEQTVTTWAFSETTTGYLSDMSAKQPLQDEIAQETQKKVTSCATQGTKDNPCFNLDQYNDDEHRNVKLTLKKQPTLDKLESYDVEEGEFETNFDGELTIDYEFGFSTEKDHWISNSSDRDFSIRGKFSISKDDKLAVTFDKPL